MNIKSIFETEHVAETTRFIRKLFNIRFPKKINKKGKLEKKDKKMKKSKKMMGREKTSKEEDARK